MSKRINNPHDKIFKKILSDIVLAKRFFKNYLPAGVQEIINLESLSLEKGSFVDEQLKEHLTDLLYQVDLLDGDAGYIYLLLEAQSTTNDLMAFRLLKYITQIMEQHLQAQQSRKLPLVLPLVYYVGQESADKFVPDIMDCFENPTLAREHFLKPFTLIDLQRMKDDDLLRDKALAGFELLQKHIKSRNLQILADKLFAENVYLEMYNHDGNYLFIMIKYLASVQEEEDIMPIIKRAAEQVPAGEREFISYADKLRQEGHLRGRQEGRHELIMCLLKAGDITAERAAEILGLPVAELGVS